MIENFQEKLDDGRITLEFGETGIVVIERRFRENDGVPVMKPTQEVSSQQLDDLIADNERQREPFERRAQDLADMKIVVEAKERERAELIEANEKPKDKKK